MGEMMEFPETVEEFMEKYKVTDTEHVYSNGMEMVPIFRMRQWFEHLHAADVVEVPCRIGDRVWALRSFHGVLHVKEGTVGEMFFTNVARRPGGTRQDVLMIVVRNVCRGLWGERIFPTREAAEAELARLERQYDD